MPAVNDTIATPGLGGRYRAGVPEPTVPSAIANLAVGEWAAVSNNTLASIDPEDDPGENPNFPGDAPWHASQGQQAVITNWNGGCYARNVGNLGSLIYWGGGHNGYDGNEIYLFDIETLTWVMHTSPTRAADNSPTSKDWGFDPATGTFHDGHPPAVHTYDRLVYDPRNRRFWVFARGDPGGINSATPQFTSDLPAYFDFDTGEWALGPQMLVNSDFGVTGFDEAGQAIWIGYQQDTFVQHLNLINNSYTAVSTSSNTVREDNVAAVDPVRRIFVVLDGVVNNRLNVLDLDDLAAAAVPITPNSTVGMVGQMGFTWVQDLGAFVAYKSGLTYYTLTPPATDWQTGTWLWEPHTATGQAPTSPTEPPGPYTRFQYVPELGVALLCNGVGNPTFALRLVDK